MFALHITYVARRSFEIKAPQIAVCLFADDMVGARRYGRSSLDDFTGLISRPPLKILLGVSARLFRLDSTCADWPPS